MQTHGSESHSEKNAAQQICATSAITALSRTQLSSEQKTMLCVAAIEELKPTIYPRVYISYGKVQYLASEAEHDAGQLNSKMDISAVRAAALDDMFSQGQPLPGSVDTDNVVLLALELRMTGPRTSHEIKSTP